LVEELVQKNFQVGEEFIKSLPKMTLIERRGKLIELINELSGKGAKEAAEDIKAGNIVEAAAAKAAEDIKGGSATSGPTPEPMTLGVTQAPAAEAPVKEKKKPGPKPGQKKAKAGDNKPTPVKVASLDEDPIMTMAARIEKIKDRGTLEEEIRVIIDETAVDEFALGGMLAKAQATPEWWNQHYQSFRDYVEAVSGVKYRKAMYCIEMYIALLKMDRPWAAFQGIGWTKILALTRIVTKETPEDQFIGWINDAKLLSVEALKAKIENALKPEAEKKPEAETDVKSMTFKLHSDQREVVEAALEVAMKAVNTDTKAVGLEAMAQSYMGTGLAFKGWLEALTYARKHSDDPLVFAQTVIETLEKLCPEVLFPVVELDLRTDAQQAAE
jgi:hypothetical protein